jgi:hypothetical protein
MNPPLTTAVRATISTAVLFPIIAFGSIYDEQRLHLKYNNECPTVAPACLDLASIYFEEEFCFCGRYCINLALDTGKKH